MNHSNAGSPSASGASAAHQASQNASSMLPARNGAPGSGAPMLLSKAKLQELIKHVDPNEQLDDDVEEVLLHSLDKFIENLVSNACDMAKHRKGTQLEVQDVESVLERKTNAWIPGFMNFEESNPARKSSVTEAHKQRMAVIRKTLKK